MTDTSLRVTPYWETGRPNHACSGLRGEAEGRRINGGEADCIERGRQGGEGVDSLSKVQ